MKSFGKMVPLWTTYLVLFVLSACGPLLSLGDGLMRGHWAFLFLLPFALGSIPLSFIIGELVQARTRGSSRFAWRLGAFHALVFWAIFLVGIFDFLATTREALYFLMWLVPSVLSGLFLVLGMRVMRVEQAHSDARYGVEVRQGDPWASFFDLQWEGGGRGGRSRSRSRSRSQGSPKAKVAATPASSGSSGRSSRTRQRRG